MKNSFPNWIHFIHYFDLFAVPFTPSLCLKSKQSSHSSVFGGFISLIVYFLSCYYGISIMQQWLNNDMVLKVQQQQNGYQNEIYQNYFSEKNNITRFEFYVFSNDEFGPDPFKNDEVFLIPIILDPEQKVKQNLLSFHNQTTKSLVIDWSNNLLSNTVFIIFVRCIGNERYLKGNQTCGSQDKADKFFNQEGLELFLEFQLETIDFKTEFVNKSSAITKSFIQQSFSSEKLVTIQYSYYEISKAILFENANKNCLMTSFTVRDQMSTTQFLTGIYRYFLPKVKDVYAAYIIGSNQYLNHTIIQSPSLSEVLAQIGSILQTLLLSKYIIQLLNTKLMHQKFKNFFLSIFFPEIKQIQKQGRGRSRKYFLNSKEIDKKSYQELRNRIDELIEEKLNYANLIYEIAKMQAVLEEISTHFNIYNSHLKNIHIPLELMTVNNVYRVMNIWNQRDNNINIMTQTKLYPFAFNYSLSTQCQNFCSLLDNDNIDSNQQRAQTKSQLIMKLDINKH